MRKNDAPAGSPALGKPPPQKVTLVPDSWLLVLCSQKRQNDLCSFQGKPFNITVIQAYAPTSNAAEAEAERVYEALQDLLELTPKKDVLFIIGD